MRNGFIFNHDKCVNCNACSAACILENKWTVHPRNIFTYNSKAEHLLTLVNLSLACSHCESAVCMEGCPSLAYRRDEYTGAIIIDEAKCIGCRYCQWNCPYDAPKFDTESGTIGKCNLCYSGLIDGRQPACSSACPTGALSYGELAGSESGNFYTWFPDKKLNPAIKFTANKKSIPLEIIPLKIFDLPVPKPTIEGKNISKELSLIVFSFLSTLSVATVIASFIRGVFPEKVIFIPVLVVAGLVSFFHLGRKLRSWRSVMNLKKSPLSREIAALIVYTIVSSVTVFLHIPGFLIASSVIGLILLVLIDSVYIFADSSKSVMLHSGQTFLSALLIVSFFSGIVLPFLFIALIKLVLSVHKLSVKKLNSPDFSVRFLRIAFLIVSGISMISHISFMDLFIVSLFLIGEFLDRILFYIDFNPLNINTLINEQLNIERDEKKRG
jgi:Fe-S-cluster-containing dehydrogenase component/DMSO reductase anchor subunit